jgi:methionyl-tRNA formyltransferase
MRFAITAVDRYLGVFDAFVNAGWTPLKLFTVPARSDQGNQQAVIAYAEQNRAAIQLSRMAARDLAELRERGCDALIVASYDWKVCDWRPFLKYAVNFHASPLPDGRGPYPVVRAILEDRAAWGVTCHRLSPEIDGGDILAGEEFPLRPDECHESLDLKIQMAARRLASRVAGQFAELWGQAAPQRGGSYWRKHKAAEHVIDFRAPTESVLRHVRAFGANGSLACVDGAWFVVKRAVGWTERHDHPPGHAVHVFNRSIVVAARDGYVGLLDSERAPPGVVAGIGMDLSRAA